MRYTINQKIKSGLLLLVIVFFSFCKKNDYSTPAIVPDASYPQVGTPFTGVVNSQDAIIYQVNLRAFSADASFKGVTAKLDAIKDLGTTVLYLMPVYPVGVEKSAGGLGSPYSVKDYKGVNTEFGTLADLQALVAGAHERNMTVILDWVANHTSWDNAWIVNKSWYKLDAKGNIIAPPGTGWTDVAQLDYTNKDMRAAMIDAMKYWVYTANIDGFRCDAADFVPFDFWKQANDALKTITSHKLLMLAEGTRNDHFKAGFNLVYGMGYYSGLESKVFGTGASATMLQDLNTSEYATSFRGSQVVRYTTNHDVYNSDGSPVNLYGGKAGSLAAFVVTAYMKGVPMIYTGQEVGNTAGMDFFYHTPVNWSQNADITAAYKAILNFRKGSDALKNGDLVVMSSDDVAAFKKSTDKEKVLVIDNLRGNNVTYSLPATVSTTGWKDAFTGASVTLTNKIYLQPYRYMVLTQ
ncbi:alpha-amylase family glycosyl hydrolase [Mucilaginibacter gilvus]|uniref:Alpha-amylase n=1 Tax=Mucilaginibacter gilvus TaxID=2305909 RepID=A0A3S3WHW9_9SPHI|nr:alpha-amylase family glycosyl hydrolase [Mucilaginibacter gilvus]RWY57482.1 alpha-amylase [Mucilaginibacter gilvus]